MFLENDFFWGFLSIFTYTWQRLETLFYKLILRFICILHFSWEILPWVWCNMSIFLFVLYFPFITELMDQFQRGCSSKIKILSINLLLGGQLLMFCGCIYAWECMSSQCVVSLLLKGECWVVELCCMYWWLVKKWFSFSELFTKM